MTVGYSGAPLSQERGIKEGSRLLAIGSPSAYAAIVSDLPAGVRLVSRAGRTVNLAHVFSTRRADLKQRLRRLRASLRPDATIRVSWPKKASKVSTDITEPESRPCRTWDPIPRSVWPVKVAADRVIASMVMLAAGLLAAVDVSAQVERAPRLERVAMIGCDECFRAGDLRAFSEITDVAVSANGTVWVSDRTAPKLRAFRIDGTPLRAFGAHGRGPGELLSVT